MKLIITIILIIVEIFITKCTFQAQWLISLFYFTPHLDTYHRDPNDKLYKI